MLKMATFMQVQHNGEPSLFIYVSKVFFISKIISKLFETPFWSQGIILCEQEVNWPDRKIDWQYKLCSQNDAKV